MSEDPVWPYGSGGRCGPQFAKVHASMLADLALFGIRGALDHWRATNQISDAVRNVLTEDDIARMERVYAQSLTGDST